MGRVASDTAIVVVLLGATLQVLNGADGSVFNVLVTRSQRPGRSEAEYAPACSLIRQDELI